MGPLQGWELDPGLHTAANRQYVVRAGEELGLMFSWWHSHFYRWT